MPSEKDMEPVAENAVSSVRPPLTCELAHLRPCTGLEQVDRVFAVLSARPRILIGLGAAGGILTLMADRIQDPENPRSILLALAVAFAANWPLAAVLIAAFQTLLVPRRPLEAGAALRGALGRLPHLWLTLFIMEILIGTALFLLPYQLLFPAGKYSLSPLSAGLAGAVAATGLYLAALWSLAPAVVLLEGRMLFDALGRSAELMRLRFTSRLFGDSAMRRLLLMMLLLVPVVATDQLAIPVLQWLLAGMPPLDLTDGVLPTQEPSSPGWEAAQLSLSVGFLCVFYPWLQTALASLYTECRIRREGIDLQTRLLAREGASPLKQT